MYSEDQQENKSDSTNNSSENSKNERWHCPICKKPLKSPVVTPCGHIFCWPCISKQLQHEDKELRCCPTCFKHIDIDKLVPIYGQTNEAKDADAPPPPKAERVETEEEVRERNYRNNQNNPNNQYNNNFNFQFGFFPMGGGIQFTYRNGNGFQVQGGDRQGLKNSIFVMFLFVLLPVIFSLFGFRV